MTSRCGNLGSRFIFALGFAWAVTPAPMAAAAAASGDTVAQRAVGVERAELVMGTIARIAVPEGPAGRDDAALEAAFAALRRIDASMSLYAPGSELSRVNAHAARHPEQVDADFFDLLARARVLSDESDGAFDVTILPLLRLWGAYPELRALGGGNRGVGFEGLSLDAATRTVSFRLPGMALDLGGIAKGYALDAAGAALRAGGVRRARLDLGGELAFVGSGPNEGWRVAVRDPRAPEAPLGVLVVGPDAAVSTSGNYARDFAVEGWRGRSHIYDPRTGRPVLEPLAVTVWAADSTTADALSTALLVVGADGAPAVLAREPGAGALFVERGGSVRLAGFPPLAWHAAGGERAATEKGSDRS